MNKKVLMAGVLLIAVAAVVWIVSRGSADKVSLDIDDTVKQAEIALPSLIECASTADAPLSNVPGFTTAMATYSLDQWRGHSTNIKTETRTFSLADYADSKANPVNPQNPVEQTTLKEDLFHEGERTDFSSKTEFSAGIQICDKNNMTASSNALEEVPYTINTKDSIGFQGSLQALDRITNGLPTEPGDYRIDGYMYVNGKWILTNRIDKITLTK